MKRSECECCYIHHEDGRDTSMQIGESCKALPDFVLYAESPSAEGAHPLEANTHSCAKHLSDMLFDHGTIVRDIYTELERDDEPALVHGANGAPIA